jgi:hypothetical protein
MITPPDIEAELREMQAARLRAIQARRKARTDHTRARAAGLRLRHWRKLRRATR